MLASCLATRCKDSIVYDAASELKVIDLPVEEGNKAAARQLGINESMVRRWSRQRDELTHCVLLPCYRHCSEKSIYLIKSSKNLSVLISHVTTWTLLWLIVRCVLNMYKTFFLFKFSGCGLYSGALNSLEITVHFCSS